MFKYLKIVLLFSVLWKNAESQVDTYAIVAPRVHFVVHRTNQARFIFNDSPSDVEYVVQMCPPNVPISWIVHGWMEGYFTQTEWIPNVVTNTLQAAGGCVIVMDYSFYSAYGKGYGEIVGRYQWLRDVLVNAMKMFGKYDRMHCFGFSFGARLCQGAGNVITNEFWGFPVIGRMDLCDPAGPDFDGNSRRVPAMKAAKNVACINTSDDLGTKIYDCHQNFRMGHCGRKQDGATSPPKKSHGLCPYFYNLAFTHNFKYNKLYENECYKPVREVNQFCKNNMIMGYRNKLFCNGDINIPTSKNEPYVYIGK